MFASVLASCRSQAPARGSSGSTASSTGWWTASPLLSSRVRSDSGRLAAASARTRAGPARRAGAVTRCATAETDLGASTLTERVEHDRRRRSASEHAEQQKPLCQLVWFSHVRPPGPEKGYGGRNESTGAANAPTSREIQHGRSSSDPAAAHVNRESRAQCVGDVRAVTHARTTDGRGCETTPRAPSATPWPVRSRRTHWRNRD